MPRIGNIEVDRGVVRYRDAKADADVRLSLQTGSGAGAPLGFQGEGKLHGEGIRLEGVSTGLAQLQEMDDPYKFRLHATNGRTVVDFDGTAVPSDAENLRGTLAISGPDLAKLYPVVPTPLPWTPPYRLKGEISHVDDVWHYRDFTGTVGASDLAGSFKVDATGKRPATIADLRSRRFDYKDLGGFVGLPPGGRAIEQHKRDAPRMLPDKPLELAKLRDHDVDLRFRGESVKWGSVPIDNLDAHLVLKDGVMRFTPANFGLAGGNVVANVTVDVTRNVPRAEADVTALNVELKKHLSETRLAARQRWTRRRTREVPHAGHQRRGHDGGSRGRDRRDHARRRGKHAHARAHQPRSRARARNCSCAATRRPRSDAR